MIPKELRKRYGIKPGSQVSVLEYGRTQAIVPLGDDPVESTFANLADLPGEPLSTDTVVEEHRREREREDARLRPRQMPAK